MRACMCAARVHKSTNDTLSTVKCGWTQHLSLLWKGGWQQAKNAPLHQMRTFNTRFTYGAFGKGKKNPLARLHTTGEHCCRYCKKSFNVVAVFWLNCVFMPDWREHFFFQVVYNCTVAACTLLKIHFKPNEAHVPMLLLWYNLVDWTTQSLIGFSCSQRNQIDACYFFFVSFSEDQCFPSADGSAFESRLDVASANAPKYVPKYL